MIVALSGSTGFIGQSLMHKMQLLGWTVRAITRDSLALSDQEFLAQTIEGADVVMNFAGAPVAGRWTPAYKQEILDSRVKTTHKITNGILHALKKPSLFISASAIGIYDSVNIHTESSVAFGHTFLSKVCQLWEQEADNSQKATRLVILRLGVVLGAEGGALKKMQLPFRIGMGGKLGDGKQAVSFIHIDDLVNAIMFIIENRSINGIVNAVSPYPSSNAEFSEKLGKVFKQPAWLTVPAFAIKMAFGEGAQVLLDGQTALPEKLQSAGFRFQYPTLQNTLMNIYG